MQRFTISLDDDLADQFGAFAAQNGYDNRSEAVRDLIRERLGREALAGKASGMCVANASFVYDHDDHAVSARVLDLQHAHHDIVMASMHSHLDHHHCLETVVLRGPTASVQRFARALVALRGVRHGQVHLIPMVAAEARRHRHHADQPRHLHLRPLA